MTARTASHGESPVGLADALSLHIGKQVRDAAGEALAARVQRLAQRVELVAAKFAGHMASIHCFAAKRAPRRRLELGVLDERFQVLRGEKVGLLQIIVVGSPATPSREAAISRLRLGEPLTLARDERGPKAMFASPSTRAAEWNWATGRVGKRGARARTRIQPWVTSFDDCEIAANRASGEAGCIAADFATHNAARQLILKSLRTWFFCLVRECRADHRNGADAQGDEERLHRRIAQLCRRCSPGMRSATAT